MAFPTALNSQITDALAQSGVQVGAFGPILAVELGLLAYAHAMGVAMENAAAAQARTQLLAATALAGAASRITTGGR